MSVFVLCPLSFRAIRLNWSKELAKFSKSTNRKERPTFTTDLNSKLTYTIRSATKSSSI